MQETFAHQLHRQDQRTSASSQSKARMLCVNSGEGTKTRQGKRCIKMHYVVLSVALSVRSMFLLPKNTPLVGGLNPSEKYEFVNWDDDIPN